MVNVSFQELVEFSNYVAVVTKTSDVGEILLDGQLLAKQSLWSTVPSWGFSYVTVAVSHGPHVISVADRSSACFLAYSYGHSNFPASTSAYGYTIVFQSMHAVLHFRQLIASTLLSLVGQQYRISLKKLSQGYLWGTQPYTY